MKEGKGSYSELQGELKHATPPIKFQCQQDMPVGSQESSKIQKVNRKNKGYHEIAQQQDTYYEKH
jgi:hypothetical protein